MALNLGRFPETVERINLTYIQVHILSTFHRTSYLISMFSYMFISHVLIPLLQACSHTFMQHALTPVLLACSHIFLYSIHFIQRVLRHFYIACSYSCLILIPTGLSIILRRLLLLYKLKHLNDKTLQCFNQSTPPSKISLLTANTLPIPNNLIQTSSIPISGYTVQG